MRTGKERKGYGGENGKKEDDEDECKIEGKIENEKVKESRDEIR